LIQAKESHAHALSSKARGESWHLKRHHTSSNISTKAMFSILSGLYDFFSRETFGTRSDASVPSIYNFLAPTHESFLVTPASITWYFSDSFPEKTADFPRSIAMRI